MLTELYKPSLGLLTDLYQLTMAYGYWKSGLARREAAFHVTFRDAPFAGGFTVAAGLAPAVELVTSLRFDASDRAFLAAQRGNDQRPLFDPAFLDELLGLKLSLDVDAVPEGTVVFPHEPLVRVTGPILQAQLVETALLNLINFQTLIATKAARVCLAARGDAVIEFGLRRAQGFDGGISATRAAYIGGCDSTSNVLAGKLFGIPVKGTHAHSWVMCFDDEVEAFTAWAEAMPNNAVFLVDTYDSLKGVRHAITVAERLRARGHELAGIRLDSGDLAYLSIEARRMLDAAGFPDASIIASNELDEQVISSLKEQGAAIDAWGAGTRLVTGDETPALSGVYKLAALKDAAGVWQPKIKLSEQSAKVSTPGVLQVRRFRQGGEYIADAIYDTTLGLESPCTLIDPHDATREKTVPDGTAFEDLLVPVLRAGKLVYDVPPLGDARQRTREQLAKFHAGVKRLVNPHRYPAGLERRSFDQRARLIRRARSASA
jgi:nicotinate phosphoribosyltransferase